ncbi:MAG: hypothetical protein HYX32_00910 [Actinobacteria bacterium]|nr:hypothetical protein [Actinomycetota bacterium]
MMKPSTLRRRLQGDDGQWPERARRLRDDTGYVLAVTALFLVPMVAFTAYAVDLGAWFARAAKIQRAADAAALAAAPMLPDNAKAASAAVQSLVKNGFCTTGSTSTCTPTDPDVSVTMGPVTGSTTKYFVTLQDAKVDQYFSKLARPGGTLVNRQGTAERIRPVPMGSPRNFLGTGGLQSGFAKENLWASVSGYCARNEHGDRITPYADANGSSGAGRCDYGASGAPSWLRKNVDYNANGYFYGIEFPANLSGNYSIQIYDAAQCQYEGTAAGDSGADDVTPRPQRQYTFTVRSNNSNDPSLATVLQTTTIGPNTNAPAGGSLPAGPFCGAWRNLYTFVNPSVGTYYLQVNPVIPTNKLVAEGQNQFGIRVRQPTGYTPCVNDPTEQNADVTYNANCPKVFALTHLGVYAAFSGSTPSFYLASVGAEHAGKTMEVELFDPAEGATRIELLDPRGNPVNFTWEIGCKDARYQSDTGTACATGESPPSGGYGNLVANYVDVSGDGTKPFAQLTQTGKYSDRLLRLRTVLRSDYATYYGSLSWWKIRYTVCSSGCSIGDRTTWTVRIKGDPVRLVPNS